MKTQLCILGLILIVIRAAPLQKYAERDRTAIVGLVYTSKSRCYFRPEESLRCWNEPMLFKHPVTAVTDRKRHANGWYSLDTKEEEARA